MVVFWFLELFCLYQFIKNLFVLFFLICFLWSRTWTVKNLVKLSNAGLNAGPTDVFQTEFGNLKDLLDIIFCCCCMSCPVYWKAFDRQLTPTLPCLMPSCLGIRCRILNTCLQLCINSIYTALCRRPFLLDQLPGVPCWGTHLLKADILNWRMVCAIQTVLRASSSILSALCFTDRQPRPMLRPFPTWKL